MLHRSGVFAQAGSPISAALQRLQDQLMPCFLLVQPLQQSKKARKGAPDGRVKIMAGPLARLPTRCQVTFTRLKGPFSSICTKIVPPNILSSNEPLGRAQNFALVLVCNLTDVQSAFLCIC